MKSPFSTRFSPNKGVSPDKHVVQAASLVRPFAAPTLLFETSHLETSGMTQQERDNLRLYDHQCRALAHKRNVQEAQLADWAEAQGDALDEAYDVACTLPCSLTQARTWQADESDEGRARWASFVQEVKTSRLIDCPSPVTVVDTPADLDTPECLADADGVDGDAQRTKLSAGGWGLVACGFLAGAPLLWWVLGEGVTGGVLAAVALTCAVACGFVGWGARAAQGQAWADGDEEDAA